MKRMLSLLLALTMMMSLCSACGNKTSDQSEAPTPSQQETPPPEANNPEKPAGDKAASYKRAIRIATTGDMPSSCPYGNSSTQTSITTNSTFNGLVTMNQDGTAAEELATSWEANGDSTVWTFKLREGVKFHDGSEFTSGDVKFTWEYASSTESEGINWPITGYDMVDSIETPDTYTVVFNMKQSSPDWLFYAAQKIMSKNAVETLGAEKGGSIGTGPYQMKSQETGVSWTICRYDGYWGETPVTEEMTFVVITDASARALTLRSGDVDAIFEANASDIIAFQADNSYNVYKAENSANVYLGFNCGEGSKGANEIIRQAVAMAINRTDIVNACYENGACAVESFNVINNVTPGYVDVEYIPYDVEGAAKLLKDNGLENVTLNLTTFAKYLSVAEIVQAELAMAGITVNIRELAQSGFTGNLKSDTSAFDMYVNATSSSGGVLNIMSRFFATNASASALYYSDAQFDALLETGIQSKTYDEMIAAYGEMQKYLAKTVPAVALAQTYLWCIGSSNFYGVDLGTQTYDVDFTNSCVVE